ncbi:MAG TPA: PP2C family serine/threonine-protein phosphatase [Methanoregulaceae archaeon]|nr:PP2C family serine/threonine-protein phosphatase [Methanoregulaceae archaeon]
MADVHYYALTDRWSSGSNNDAYCAEKIGKYHVFAVSEGLIDLPGSISSSGIAIDSLRRSVKTMDLPPAAVLETALFDAESRIERKVRTSPGFEKDATHLSACLLDDAMESTILDTGEGNAYVIDSDSIGIPQHHPAAGQTKSLDIFLQGDSEEQRLKKMISRTLGEPHLLKMADFISIDISNRFLLLSSGGLHDYVKKERIMEIVAGNGENVETSCEQLREEALRSGSERTITVVLVHGHMH